MLFLSKVKSCQGSLVISACLVSYQTKSAPCFLPILPTTAKILSSWDNYPDTSRAFVATPAMVKFVHFANFIWNKWRIAKPKAGSPINWSHFCKQNWGLYYIDIVVFLLILSVSQNSVLWLNYTFLIGSVSHWNFRLSPWNFQLS